MAKKATTAKKTTKKAVKRKTGGDRNSTPKLKTCPSIANLTRPHTTESSGKLASKVTEFIASKLAWTESVRAAYAGGAKKEADLPEFPTSRFVNPNTGLMSRSAHEALAEQWGESEVSGEVILSPRYNPVMVELIHAMNCQSVRRGSVKKHRKPPTNWDEKAYGNWWHEYKDEDGNTVKDPSGWFVESKMPRPCHASRAEELIDDPDKNILTFGNNRYVVGMGSHDKAACFMIWQTSHGNYRSGDSARKRMSLAGNKDIRNVVFRIEDRPNNEGGVTVKGLWTDVREMVYLPGQATTAGYLFDSKGKQLDAKDIRALDADTKGLKFKALEAPIVGKPVPWSKLWAEIQVVGKAAIKKMRERGGRSEEFEAGDTETKSITNICVNGKRVDPNEGTPFGLKGSQINQPAYIVADGQGRIEDGCFSMGVVIGARANAPYNVSVHEAKAENAEATPAPAPKPKVAAKPKAEKKAAKSKAAAKKTTPKAPKPADAAPPVEADTAEEGVEEEVEETVAAE